MNPLSAFDSTIMASKKIPALRSGMTVRVYQKIKEGQKTRTQVFEGIIIAKKHGDNPNGTITVRKVSGGIGVERTFPIYSPNVERFEVVKTSKVRRAKLYYLREKTSKETRKKTKVLEIKTQDSFGTEVASE